MRFILGRWQYLIYTLGLFLHLRISLKQRTTLPFEVLNLRQQIIYRYLKVNRKTVHTEIFCCLSTVELFIQPDCIFIEFTFAYATFTHLFHYSSHLTVYVEKPRLPSGNIPGLTNLICFNTVSCILLAGVKQYLSNSCLNLGVRIRVLSA